MAFGYPDPVVFDPLTSSTTTVPIGDGTNIFCAGHTNLPDGRVFVAGGNIATHVGTSTGRIFNPVSNTWSATPDMTQGRWYPTLTTLADGRVLTLSGEMNCEHCYAPIPEIYNPATNSWSQLADRVAIHTVVSARLPVVERQGRRCWHFRNDRSKYSARRQHADLDDRGLARVRKRQRRHVRARQDPGGRAHRTDSNTQVASTAVARVLDMNVGFACRGAPSRPWRSRAPTTCSRCCPMAMCS